MSFCTPNCFTCFRFVIFIAWATCPLKCYFFYVYDIKDWKNERCQQFGLGFFYTPWVFLWVRLPQIIRKKYPNSLTLLGKSSQDSLPHVLLTGLSLPWKSFEFKSLPFMDPKLQCLPQNLHPLKSTYFSFLLLPSPTLSLFPKKMSSLGYLHSFQRILSLVSDEDSVKKWLTMCICLIERSVSHTQFLYMQFMLLAGDIQCTTDLHPTCSGGEWLCNQ